MSLVEFRRITGERLQIDIFSAESFRHLGQFVPARYTESADTWAMYVDGVMKGGFVIARGDLMRCPTILPKESVPGPLSEICEASQVWITKDLANTKTAWRLWWKIRSELLHSSARYVLVPWLASNKGMGRFCRNFGIRVVYEGRPKGELPGAELVIGCLDTKGLHWTRMIPLMLALN